MDEMTEDARRVRDLMVGLVLRPETKWRAVAGEGVAVVRWVRTLRTPRSVRNGTVSLWSQDTYPQIMTVSLVGNQASVRIRVAPWTSMVGEMVSLDRVREILSDPETYADGVDRGMR